MDKALGIMR